MFANFTIEKSKNIEQILKPNLSDKIKIQKTISTQIPLDTQNLFTKI